MGVKNLWSILAPAGELCTINELRGKIVAVDLAAWVCENSNGGWTKSNVVKNPHLRNLFFRTLYLVTHEVHLVFVIDGQAPHVKSETIQKRHVNRSNDGKPKELKNLRDNVDEISINRNRFNDVLHQVSKLYRSQIQ